MLHHIARGFLAGTLTAMSWAGLAAPADAATAHNSQAGSFGPTTHNCAPTPYFPAGGCASTIIRDELRYPFDVPPPPYHPGRRLDRSSAPADPFGD